MAGVVLGSRSLVGAIRELHSVTGAVPDPLGAYLLIRGIKTLALRVTRQNENAQRVAEFLEAHPKIERVHYRFPSATNRWWVESAIIAVAETSTISARLTGRRDVAPV